MWSYKSSPSSPSQDCPTVSISRTCPEWIQCCKFVPCRGQTFPARWQWKQRVKQESVVQSQWRGQVTFFWNSWQCWRKAKCFEWDLEVLNPRPPVTLTYSVCFKIQTIWNLFHFVLYWLCNILLCCSWANDETGKGQTEKMNCSPASSAHADNARMTPLQSLTKSANRENQHVIIWRTRSMNSVSEHMSLLSCKWWKENQRKRKFYSQYLNAALYSAD